MDIFYSDYDGDYCYYLVDTFKMKAKDRFMEMFFKLPERARRELVYGYPNNPMTLNVVMIEIKNNTIFSKQILSRLGFKDI
jgi:hypothetical protein